MIDSAKQDAEATSRTRGVFLLPNPNPRSETYAVFQ